MICHGKTMGKISPLSDLSKSGGHPKSPPPEVQQIAILMVGLGAFGDERNCMFYIAGLKLVRG
jgi:hypothetical protein